MTTLTEPQVWTVIGVLAASLVGTITVTTQLMMRAFSTQLTGLRNEMILRFEHVDERFERVERRLEALDGDVAAIARKVFPGGRD